MYICIYRGIYFRIQEWGILITHPSCEGKLPERRRSCRLPLAAGEGNFFDEDEEDDLE